MTSRLRPGLDGGYTVSTLQRAAMLRDAGIPVTILTVDLHPDCGEFLDEFRTLGLADDRTVMRNLLEELRNRPSLAREAADVALPPTIDETAAVTVDAPDLDASGQPWRQVFRDASGSVVFTDFFDAQGIPLFRLPFLAAPDWWRAAVVIDVFDAPEPSPKTALRVGGLAGFRALYRTWWDAVVAELRASAPERPVIAIAEARQVGELLVGAPDLRVVHTVHNAHTLFPHHWDSPMDTIWSGWIDTLAGYDAVVWLTERQREDVARLRPSHGAPDWVIPHPAHLPPDVRIDPRKIAGAAGRDPYRAVMVARMTPQKRIDHAILAWKRVVHAHPTARLDIHGGGPQRSQLQALIDENGLAQAVTLHDFAHDAAEHARTAAALIVSSRHEGHPLVVAEAMARGCPVVAYDIAYGPSEMVEHDVSGLLVPAGDVDALADALIGLIGDAERIDRFSRAALAWAQAAGPSRALQSWAELFRTLPIDPESVRARSTAAAPVR
jgi:poly(glycerol-phosphate) alpha-glucosyltransferase